MIFLADLLPRHCRSTKPFVRCRTICLSLQVLKWTEIITFAMGSCHLVRAIPRIASPFSCPLPPPPSHRAELVHFHPAQRRFRICLGHSSTWHTRVAYDGLINHRRWAVILRRDACAHACVKHCFFRAASPSICPFHRTHAGLLYSLPSLLFLLFEATSHSRTGVYVEHLDSED